MKIKEEALKSTLCYFVRILPPFEGQDGWNGTDVVPATENYRFFR